MVITARETQVKPGYKQTEVGVIPENWDVKLIEEIASIGSGTTPSRSAEERYYKNGTIYWVKTTDLTNSDISVTEEFVTKVALDETSLKVYPIGTVLIAMYGGFNQIGRTGLLRVPAAVNQAITAIQMNPKSLIPEYLLNVLNYRVNYWKTVASSSRKDPNITSYDIKKFPLTFPDRKEQQAIASVLSDVDALIASLDQLIAKKRDIKQATMQQLLTGKTRLPGFNGQWKVKNLGARCEFYSGGTPNTSNPLFYGGNISWITSGDLNKGKIKEGEGRITKLGFENSSAKMVKKGTLLLALYGATAGITAITEIEAAINQAVLAIIPQKDHSEFLFQKLTLLKDWLIKTYTQGGQPNLSGQIVKSVELLLPPFAEQAAIATVLSDMDAEIVALEQKREKTRTLKQGMMQELLTGKTRLL